jgi:heme/copper-type cytochrome/quinol oxidase subunit 4
MNNLLISLILSMIITVLSGFTFRGKKEERTIYIIKIFIICFITIFIGLVFLINKDNTNQEIEIGEADF